MFVKRLFFYALAISVCFYAGGCGVTVKKNTSVGGSQNSPLTISSVTLPVGYAGAAYTSTTLTASGGSGSGYTWSVSGSTSLPAGITLSAAGVLAGKPTANGTTSFTVKVTDSAAATASTSLSMTIKPGISITTAAALPDAYVGAGYSQSLAATGGSGAGYTWTLVSGASLPDGLALSAGGVLSGKPTAVGAASFSVMVTDSAQNTATTPFSASIKPGIAFAPPVLPTAYVGMAYAAQLTATGGSGTGYTWSMTTLAAVRPSVRRMAASGLPDGLSLSSDGWITGTPTTAGALLATVVVSDSAGNSASGNLQFTVEGGLVITTPSALPGGHPGDIYSQTFSATGGSGGYSWVSADLPGGLRLSADGVLSGSLPAANSYTFNVNVTDSAQGTASGTFTLVVSNELRFSTASTLLPTYVGLSYQTTFRAKGGSGGYVFTLTSGSALPGGLLLSPAGVLSGKPTAAGTIAFSVTVTDSNSNTASRNFSLTIDPGLTISTPAVLPAATVGTAYSQTLTATGGSGTGNVWTLTSGGASLSAVGLSFSNGLISGTPTKTGTATFSVSLVDDALNYTTGTFTIRVHDPGALFQVSGQITLGNACGSPSVPAMTLTIDTNPVQTATSDSSGNFAFASVPDGNYTVTPSITGANSMFYPSSLPVTVNGADVSSQNFVAALAYKVSGTVDYSGSETGQTYIWLINKYCGGNALGTSITTPGAFTIEGVPPGTYNLDATLDMLGFGYPNDVDAAGTAASDIAVIDTDVTGAAVTMVDPVQAAPPPDAPFIDMITPSDSGAVIRFEPIVGPHPLFNQIELATSYKVQWSTDPTFTTVKGATTFTAGASNGTNVLMLNDPNLAPGSTYFFRMLGKNSFGPGAWTVYSTDGVNPTGVTIGIPAGNLVSGTVTFAAQPTGPLYVGYYDMATGNVYTTRIQNPVSPQAFSLNVPTGQSYFHFATLDQNNDGMIDPGDVSNTHLNASGTAISGDMTGQDLTLNTPASQALITTMHTKTTSLDGSVTETYSIGFEVKESNKLPVAVRLMSGPHLLHPIDLPKCLDCGNNRFDYFVNTIGDRPATGDSFGLLVTYSDGTSETLNAQITAVLDAFATGLLPSGTSNTSLTPTFSWTNPQNADSYQYRFFLTDNLGNPIWQVPAPSSPCSGFCSTVTSLVWGVDPDDPANRPNIATLSSGSVYSWLIQVIDANGNSTMQRTYFKP